MCLIESENMDWLPMDRAINMLLLINMKLKSLTKGVKNQLISQTEPYSYSLILITLTVAC